jgi:hypothetical protein
MKQILQVAVLVAFLLVASSVPSFADGNPFRSARLPGAYRQAISSEGGRKFRTAKSFFGQRKTI